MTGHQKEPATISLLPGKPRESAGQGGRAFRWNTPVLFWLAVAMALSLEYWCLGPYSYIRIHDNADSFVTRTAIAKASLLSHGPSYWFPYMAGGVDRMAHDLPYTQLSFVICLVFPLWLSYALIVILQCFLAGYGTFLLCRDVLRLDDLACKVAGLGFAVFVSGLLYMQFGLYLFPLAIWALTRLDSPHTSASRGMTLAGLTGLLFGFGSSFTITIPFGLGLTFAWFALVGLHGSRRWALCWAFAVTTILPHARTIWALLDNAGSSHRAGRTFANLSAVLATLKDTPPLVWVFAPILLVLGFYTRSWRDRRFLALAFLYGFCGAGYLILDLGKLFAARSLSFVNGFQVDRFYEFSPFFGAVATGYVIGRRRRAQRGMVLVPAAILLLVAANAKYAHLKTLVSLGNATYNYKSPGIERLAPPSATGLAELWRVATVPGSIHPAYANAYGLETIDGYVNLYPKRFQLFWGKVIDPAIAGDDSLRHYFYDWGNRIYLFEAKGVGKRWPFRNSLLSLANTKFILSPKAIQDSRLEEVDRPDRPPTDRFAAALRSGLFSGRRDLFIYLNRECFPRAFVASAVRSFPNLDALNRELASSDPAALRGTVLVEQQFRESLGPVGDETGPHEVTLTEYRPDRLALRVHGQTPGVLVVSNSYSPFWECRVDGHKVPIVPADGAFWGARIDTGDHRVVFEYVPPYSRFPL